VISAVTARDARSFFEHCRYDITLQSLGPTLYCSGTAFVSDTVLEELCPI
jgi:hypothetical protein